jgi:RNA polymerase sigma-70 factor (ECF subfamily)
MIAGRADELPDERIIALVLDGDVDAFGILVRRHSSRVSRLGMSFLRDSEDAADFTQDVFVKAYTALGTFKGQSAFSTWLLRIAYNTAINAKQRRRESLALDPDDELAGDPGTDEQHERAETIAAVRAAMAELPPKQAICIELYFYYNLKYWEISEVTGYPVNTIKSHVFRAKKILRERLEAGMEAGDAL